MAAQNNLSPFAIYLEPVKSGFHRVVMLDDRKTADMDSAPLSSYTFEVLETVELSMDFSNIGYMEYNLSRPECSHVTIGITISKGMSVLGALLYSHQQRISVDSLAFFSLQDSVRLFPGEYRLEFRVSEPMPVERLEGRSGMRSRDDGPVVIPPDEPFVELKERVYTLAVTLDAQGISPAEEPLPSIPLPFLPPLTPLPSYPGENMVCIFNSHDGGMQKGNLSIHYYDDLGRLDQTIRKGFTPSGKDLATMQEYDAFGRKSDAWLPTVTTQNTGEHIQPELLKEEACRTYGGDAHPHASLVYEASPLEKVTRQYGPGNAWRARGKAIEADEFTNINGNDTLNCLCFRLTEESDMQIQADRQYQDGSLLVTRTQDEDGKAAFEFKNRAGMLVLARQVEYTAAGKQLFDTYYVYDDLKQLRAVLPPALSAQITAGSIPTALLHQYAYLYKYDKAGNQCAKKLPGVGWKYEVYDKNNRLVFSQDSVQRQRGEWEFFIPDVFGRVCLQGICKNRIDPLENGYLNKSIVCQYAGMDAEYAGYIISGPDLREMLVPAYVDPIVLIANYYDNYNFMSHGIFPPCDAFAYSKENGFCEQNASPKGLLTATMTRNLDEDTYNYAVMYYDARGRMVQTVSTNHLHGMERDCFDYSFTGKVLKHLHKHTGKGNSSLEELYTYTYDAAERLIQVAHRVNNQSEVILVQNEYDELGRVSAKAMNNGTLNTTYAYNLRNWLTDIRNPLFRQALRYTDGPGTPCYGGNISSMTWGTDSSLTRGYRFTYDGLSRLKDAAYGEGTNLSEGQNRFNEVVTAYDKNGNILRLKRAGKISSTGYGWIDDLSFSYSGNQLKAVNDVASHSVFGNDGMEFKDGAKQSVEYVYDGNGNLIKDLNKKIIDIQYNYLNLPRYIQFEGGNSISYLYSADGTKLRTVHVTGGVTTTTTDYCGKVIYENGALSKLLTEQGYVTFPDNVYHYFLQDHQGNNRVTVNQNGKAEEVNHYYPFGGMFASSSSMNVQPYKYNGKELDRKNGLDWYDYGARHYDAALGRWHVMDPMAEKYYNWSPYAYCKNNPVLRIDIDGKDDYTMNNAGRLFKTKIDESSTDRLLIERDEKVKSIIVRDKELLKGLYEMQKSWGKLETYNSTSNLKDAAAVFKFCVDNTSAEWKFDIYDDQGNQTAIIGTSGREGSVLADMQNKLKVKGDKVVDLHSHPYNAYASDRDREILKIETGVIYHKDSKTLLLYNRDNPHIQNKDYSIEKSSELLDFLDKTFIKK